MRTNQKFIQPVVCPIALAEVSGHEEPAGESIQCPLEDPSTGFKDGTEDAGEWRQRNVPGSVISSTYSNRSDSRMYGLLSTGTRKLIHLKNGLEFA